MPPKIPKTTTNTLTVDDADITMVTTLSKLFKLTIVRDNGRSIREAERLVFRL